MPREIVLQFETARNVYLYAWFVYRFYPVSEHQCLACLELEGFSAWQNRGEIRSRARVEVEKLREASEKNLTEITWDESDIQITAEDLNWDYVKMLPELLPMVRNDYAHGSTELHNWALRSFQIVSEIINQLYPAPA